MKHPLEELTPVGILETWGLRVCGGSLKDPLALSTGGVAGVDDELLLVAYVESVPDFEAARPVLAHVYARGLPVESYRYREPGETRMRAAIRHGQAEELLRGGSDAVLARRLLDRFVDALVAQCRARPFRVPRVTSGEE